MISIITSKYTCGKLSNKGDVDMSEKCRSSTAAASCATTTLCRVAPPGTVYSARWQTKHVPSCLARTLLTIAVPVAVEQVPTARRESSSNQAPKGVQHWVDHGEHLASCE
eukprot:3180255-Amphidinium_carterae.1